MVGENQERERLLDRISVDPQVCFGKPCIRGTRIWISLIIDNLAAGIPEEEILKAYPTLEKDDIKAALSYASEIARNGFIDLPEKKVV